MKTKNKKKHGASIGWKLAAYLLFFVAVVLAVTWLFQVHLLDAFHEWGTKSEMDKVAATIAGDVGSSRLDESVKEASRESSFSITVYKIKDNQIMSVAKNDDFAARFEELSLSDLSKLYSGASKTDDTYTIKRSFDGNDTPQQKMPFGREKQPTQQTKLVQLITAKETVGEDGEDYLILLSASLFPQQATVSAMQVQFTWIAVILLILSAITAFLIYRRVSKPLIQMTSAAKQLAVGKYDVKFSDKGYKETRELAETLNFAAGELSRTDNLQKELVANVSHDLRTPLTMIKGYAEMIRDIPGENTPENMQVIIDETTHLSDLVNDMLDLSRFQSGVRQPENELFNLTETAREALLRYEAFTKYRGYQIAFEATEDAFIYADRKLILQVLYNLINNAVNYTGADKKVTVKQILQDGNVRMEITDTGDGIPPEHLSEIWERYYKVDRVHRQAMVGTGLGLSIVKKILSQYDAKYGVESEVGKGSTFWFEFRVQDVKSEE